MHLLRTNIKTCPPFPSHPLQGKLLIMIQGLQEYVAVVGDWVLEEREGSRAVVGDSGTAGRSKGERLWKGCVCHPCPACT